MGGRTDQEKRMWSSSEGPAEAGDHACAEHQPASLWFFPAAPSSLQVQKKQEHWPNVGCNRRKKQGKTCDTGKKDVEILDHGVSLLNKKEMAAKGEKTGRKKKLWNQN